MSSVRILVFFFVFFLCFSQKAFGFSFFQKNKMTTESQKPEKNDDESGYKTLKADFSIEVLDLKSYHSPKKLKPLSQLKWYQKKKKWRNCLKIAESLSEDGSLGVWPVFVHLTCLTNWYKLTRGLKVSSILNSFKKLETKKNLLLNSNFEEHKRDFINSFLDICELTLKHVSQELGPLIRRNRDLIVFMSPGQKEKHRNLLSRSLNKFFDEDLKETLTEFYEKSKWDEQVRKKEEKQVKKVSSGNETRLWIQFSRAFRKRQRLKAVEYAVDFLNQFPESKKVPFIRKKTYEIYKRLFRRSGKKWNSLKKRFEKELLKANVKNILFWLNRFYSQGYYNITLDLAEKTINQKSQTDKIPELLILAGRSAYNQADFTKVKAHLQTLVEEHREHDLSHEASYLFGLLHYRQENCKKVISVYEPFLENPYSDPWELQVRYWLWRCFKKTKSSKAAKVAEVILERFPLTYYGLIVRQYEKNGLQSLIPPETQDLSSISWKTRGTEEQWKRIKKLLELGWIKEAEKEIDFLPEPEAASGFIVRGLLWHAASLFYRFIKDYAAAIDRDHRYLSARFLKMTFPRKYKEFVVGAEKEFSISRYLIWSIIRQESAFTPQAISPSKAYGLMQILGPTARETARWLKVGKFNTSRDVFKLKYNVRFGTHYFLRMLRKYKKVSPFAIASYNVGPGNLDRWLKHRKDLKDWEKTGDSLDNDLWVDELPWSETSFYVKAVLRNHLLYGIIYNENNRLPHPPWLDMTTTVSERFK